MPSVRFDIAHHQEHAEGDEPNAEIHRSHKGDVGGGPPRQVQGQGVAARHQELGEHLLPAGQPQIAFFDHLDIIVHKADGPKHQGKEEYHQMVVKAPLEIPPAGGEHGDSNTQNKHQAAHGGGASLAGVGGNVFVNILAAFEAAEPADKTGTNENRKHKSSDERGRRAEADVPKNVEYRPFGRKGDKEIIEHAA